MDDQRGGDGAANPEGEWDTASGAWSAAADRLDRWLAPVTAAMLDGLALSPGHRVLELACGPAGFGLAAADRVGPEGSVRCTDNADDMLAVAGRRIAARGLMSVSTGRADLDRLDALDAHGDGFDAIGCRFGLMFAADPAATARGIGRLLRPDGRVAVAVWDARERNPWLGLVFDAVGDELGMPVPPPGVHGPFLLGGGALAPALRAGGLADVEVRSVAADRSWPGFDEWWDETTRLAGPVAAVLASLDAAVVEAIRARAGDSSSGYGAGGVLRFPARALVGTGRRAA